MVIVTHMCYSKQNSKCKTNKYRVMVIVNLIVMLNELMILDYQYLVKTDG